MERREVSVEKKKDVYNTVDRTFIILQLRYRIIFSVRVGINEHIKMYIPASLFAPDRQQLERERKWELAQGWPQEGYDIGDERGKEMKECEGWGKDERQTRAWAYR